MNSNAKSIFLVLRKYISYNRKIVSHNLLEKKVFRILRKNNSYDKKMISLGFPRDKISYFKKIFSHIRK